MRDQPGNSASTLESVHKALVPSRTVTANNLPHSGMCYLIVRT